jgi:hypothetical protein
MIDTRSTLFVGLLAFLSVLRVSSAYASSDLFVSTTGYVGINTTSPSYWLDALSGTTSNAARLSSSSTDSTDLLLNNTTTGGHTWYVGSVGASNPAGETAGDFHIGVPGTGSWFLIDTVGDVAMPGTLTVTGVATLSGIAYPTSATSGGIPYFSSASALSSSGALTQYAVVLGGGAGGAPTTVSGLGSSGQVLTSNGSGTAPTWQNASSGGGTTLLDTVNASGSSSATFGSGYITSTYNKYVVEADSVTCQDSGDYVLLDISTNDGSSYLTGNYTGYILSFGTGTLQTLSATTESSILEMGVADSSSTDGSQFTFTFSVPSASKIFNANWVYSGSWASNPQAIYGAGANTGTTAINNIRFRCFDSGTGFRTISGNFHVYGLEGT